MYDRVKTIRTKVAKLNQVDFGKKVGLSGSAVSLIEHGKNTPANSTIIAICHEFNVNEEWLRHGVGEMLQTESLAEHIARAIEQAGSGTAKAALFHLIAELPDDTLWDAIRYVRQVLSQFPPDNDAAD